MRRSRGVFLVVIWGLIACPALVTAGGRFTIGGRPVESQDTNFAGARHTSPKHRIVVQINHDTQPAGNLELTVVDDVFGALLTDQRRAPYIPVDSMPVVFIAELKMRRFIEGPRRLLFGKLETEIKKQYEVYPSPNAIFITDTVLANQEKLEAALRLGLSYLFNADFYRAVGGLEHALPRPAD